MVAVGILASSALTLASGALLVAFAAGLRRLAHERDDAAGARRVTVAMGLLAVFAIVRTAQGFLTNGGGSAVYAFRNTAFLVAGTLAFLAIVRPGTPGRVAGFVLAGTAGAAGVLTIAVSWSITAFALGLGLLAATAASVAWSLPRDGPARGVRQLALFAAFAAVAWPWIDGLLIVAAFGGDPGVFLLARTGTDLVFAFLAACAIPAARAAAPIAAAPPAAAATPSAPAPLAVEGKP